MQTKAKPASRRRVPTTVKRTVTPRRPTNQAVRTREYLTADEIARLLQAARTRGGRYGHRDATMILLGYRHGLRVGELVALRWDQVDFTQAHLHVRRLKHGRPSVHTLRGSELRMLRRLQREQAPPSPYLFTTERRTPMTVAGFQKLFTRIGLAAEFPFPVHPHMLRHACGFKLANDGVDTRAIQEWMGHSNIQHTTRYTEMSPKRFKNFWEKED